MKRLAWLIAISMAVAVLSSGEIQAEDPIRSEDPTTKPYAQSWVLVKLKAPLIARESPSTFSLHTARPDLDAWIAQSGVQEIEHALAVSARAPRYPEAFRRYGLDRTYRFYVPESSDIEALSESLSRLPSVEYATPDYIPEPEGSIFPDDPELFQQWGLHNLTDTDIDAPEAWDISTGPGGLIGILDSGVLATHEDLVGKVLEGHDFVDDHPGQTDPEGHGTHVGSVMAAVTDNALGMAGVCCDCKLLPGRIFGGTLSDWADGLVWATDQGARVINISGGEDAPDVTLLGGVNYAYDAGVVLIGGAGNGNHNFVNYPKAYKEFIAASGTNQDDDHAAPFTCSGSGTGGSNYGAEVDVCAPADRILGAELEGGYHLGCGNSLAGPHIAGLVAIMHTIYPSMGRDEARHLLRYAAEDQVGDPAEDLPGFDIYHGWGRINMERTLLETQAAISLRVDGAQSTRVFLETASPLADSYDFIRGDLTALSETAEGVDLGTVVCLENDSIDADTAGGDEDTVTPDPGEVFFYVARVNAAPGAGSYGGSSRNRDRKVAPIEGASWITEGDQLGAQFGVSVASAGDVNGDGFDDVIVGAYRYDSDQVDEGAAFVYLGSAGGLAATPHWTAEGDQASAAFGWSVASAGDVNNDGFDDVIVGAPLYDNPGEDEGRAYVYLGSASGLNPDPAWTGESDQAGAWYGYQVSTAGQVNDDPYDDVIVGAPFYDNVPDGEEGRAYVYLGSGSGVEQTEHWIGEGDFYEGHYGQAVGTAGDVDNDGYDEVVVGAPDFTNQQTHEGRIFVYRGTSTGLRPAYWTIHEINVNWARLGNAVGTAGDVNNDGYADVVAGAWTYGGSNLGDQQLGLAVVYLGSASGLPAAPDWSVEGDQNYGWFGFSVGAAGNVNDDLYDDIIVGTHAHDSFRSNDGLASVFFGSAVGPSTVAQWTDTPGQAVGQFGWRVASAGDVNGDGYDDIIVGAPLEDADLQDEGRAYVYLGSSSGPEVAPPNTDCPR